MSTEPLQEYFDILSVIGTTGIEVLNSESGVDIDKAISLYEMGFITGRNRSTQQGLELGNVKLSPNGAAIMAEWASILERGSIKGRFMSVLEKVVWLFVGMLFTVAGVVITKVVNGI